MKKKLPKTKEKLKLMLDEYEPRDWHYEKVKDYYEEEIKG